MAEVATRTRWSFDRDAVLGALQSYGVYAAIVVLLAVDASLNIHFLDIDNLRVQLYQLAPVLVVALGMALVIGTEGIDLSVGAVIAISSAIVPLYLGYGVAVCIVVALIAGGLSGVLAGLMVAVVNVQPIVATAEAAPST